MDIELKIIMVTAEVEPSMDRFVAAVSQMEGVEDVVLFIKKIEQHLSMDLDRERREEGAFG